jgi:hypothetical protein
MAVRLLLGAQLPFPSILNVPPVALVETTVEYLVRVRRLAAVTCAQQRFVRGYSSVPVPIVITTGAVMVVASGIA